MYIPSIFVTLAPITISLAIKATGLSDVIFPLINNVPSTTIVFLRFIGVSVHTCPIVLEFALSVLYIDIKLESMGEIGPDVAQSVEGTILLKSKLEVDVLVF